MFDITGTNIRLTRGDTAAMRVELTRTAADGTESAYEMAEGDVITFAARRSCGVQDVLRLQSASAEILFSPEDTKDLPAEDYTYTLRLTTAAGDVYTVIDGGTLTLTRG